MSGAGLARLTVSDAAENAVWSPDGNFIAFANRREVVCTRFVCLGAGAGCDLQYIAASLRDVPAGSPDAPGFRVPDTLGRSINLGCDLSGWTR